MMFATWVCGRCGRYGSARFGKTAPCKCFRDDAKPLRSKPLLFADALLSILRKCGWVRPPLAPVPVRSWRPVR